MFGEAGQLPHVVDWLQSGNDGNSDSGFPAFAHVFHEHRIIEEHLCDDVIGARIDFLLEVLHVGFEVG